MLNFILEAKKNGYLLQIFLVQLVFKESKGHKVFKDHSGIQGVQGIQGPQGETGNGIATIVKTSTSGLVDTYTITFTDGTTTTFEVTNGQDGEVTEEELDEVKEINQRLLNNTPKGTTNTNPAYINDSADLPLNKFVLEGKTEQDSTTGKNKFNINGNVNTRYDGTTNTNNTVSGNDLTSITNGGSTRGYGQKIYVGAGNTITFSTKLKSITYNETPTGTLAYISVYNDNTTEGSVGSGFNVSQINTTKSITFTSTTDYIYVAFTRATVTTSATFTDIQVELGDEVTPWEPYTGGIPSPNPNYPQEIKNVENSRNLFNKDDVEFIEAVLNDNGQTTASSTSHYTSNYYPVLPNTTYCLSGTLIYSDTVRRIYFYNQNKNWIARSDSFYYNTSPIVFTTPANCYFIQIQVPKQITLQTGDVQLEKGSIATPYVPYNQGIQIKKTNNLFDNGQIGKYFNTQGNYETVSTASTTSYIPAKAEDVYTISCVNDTQGIVIASFDENYNLLQRNATRTKILTHTCPVDTAYIIASNYNAKNNTTMLNKGSVAIPLQEKTYNFPLSEGQKLMQDGTAENKVKNEWREVVYNGSVDEGWALNGSSTSPTNRTVIRKDNQINIANENDEYISNMFIRNSETSNRLIFYSSGIYLSLEDSITGIQTNDSNEVKLTKMLTYLSNNPVQAQIKLATPDETPFTEAQQSVIDEIISDGTYKEVTYYTAEASINPDMEIGYYKDLEILLNNL